MILYTIALLLHVSGVIGACVSLSIWLFGLSTLRRAHRVEQVRALAWLIIIASPLMVGSVVPIGAAGLDMALSTWSLQTPWIAVALVGVVLSIARSGASIADIAAALCLSEGTVRNHLSLAMQKLGARNQMEAAWLAEQKGWL